MSSFAEKYNATPFDVKAELTRQTILTACLESNRETHPDNGEEFHAIVAGAVLGATQFVMSHVKPEDHAAVRSGLLTLIPWAVDLTRATDGLNPLAEA